MIWPIDARIPVVVSDDASRAAAVLGGGDPVPPGTVAFERIETALLHAPVCSCCGGRLPLAIALDRLFQGRVRGTVPWFERVVVRETLANELHAALRDDALSAARFRFVAKPR